MVHSIARLTAADEYPIHQIANTFATVGSSDFNWTEKIWFTLMSKDGTQQVNFGIGKYPNRNVLDGFAGTCRRIGDRVEQRTVRASRELDPGLLDTVVGPLCYEVIEPFHKLRITLAENDAQPLQFDLTFHDRMQPFFEERDVEFSRDDAGRQCSDVVRYHQSGTISGWILIDGERIEVKPDEWFGFRDRSWGVRDNVGLAIADLMPKSKVMSSHFNWFVSQIQRPDGSFYEFTNYFRGVKDGQLEHFTAFINESDGRQIPVLQAYPEMRYRASDHGFISGKIYALIPGPGRKIEERVFTLEAIDPVLGFRLHTALYGPWKGMAHGSWKGKLHIDGECIDDVAKAFTIKENFMWQVGDRPILIREGDNIGYGDLESGVSDDPPEGVTLV